MGSKCHRSSKCFFNRCVLILCAKLERQISCGFDENNKIEVNYKYYMWAFIFELQTLQNFAEQFLRLHWIQGTKRFQRWSSYRDITNEGRDIPLEAHLKMSTLLDIFRKARMRAR